MAKRIDTESKMTPANLALAGAVGFLIYKLVGGSGKPQTPPPPPGTTPPVPSGTTPPVPSGTTLNNNLTLKLSTPYMATPEVRELQNLLNKDLADCKARSITKCAGLSAIQVDGVFGPMTERLLFALHSVREIRLIETGFYRHNLLNTR